MTNETTGEAAQPQTYYDILGVRPDAPPSLVHAAYVAALKYYRENYDTDPGAQAGLDQVRLAYKVIGNADGRAAYDATLNLEAPTHRKPSPYLKDVTWLGGKIIDAITGRSSGGDDRRAR